jgi:pseudouridine kinase
LDISLSTTTHKVLCIGSVLIDIKAFSDEPVEKGSYQKGTIQIVPGGVAYCMAVNLAYLGFSTSILTVFGSDMFGRYLKKQLTDNHIDTALCREEPDAKTAIFSVCTDTDAASYCIYDNAIFQHINIDNTIYEYMEKNGIHTLVLDSNIPDSALKKLYTVKQEKNLFIFQNATSPVIAFKSRPFIPYIDLFACNEFEAEAITGEKAAPDYKTARLFSQL